MTCPKTRFLNVSIHPTIRKTNSVLKRKSPRLRADKTSNLEIQKVPIPETGQRERQAKRPNPPKKLSRRARSGPNILK